ncbi:hypothetical protein GGI07_004128 [Coemansia sp. Benny D115]|nr:hypothetical protein GGI07_004128 [Coemansia sp. Benny D115]
MKVTSSIYALAFAAVCAASGDYYASSAPVAPVAPAMPSPAPSMTSAAPQVPPAPSTTPQAVSVSTIPVIVADFIFSSASTMPAVPMPSPAMSTVEPSMPAPAPAPVQGYVASSAPGVPGTAVIPANPSPQPEPSASPSSSWPVAPTPTQPYRGYVSNKRSLDQEAIDKLVEGTGAMVFNANGNSYMLLRLPVELAKKASEGGVELRKRASQGDLMTDATTKDLDSQALLYDVLGHVFARVILPVNSKIGITNPEDDGGIGGLLRRDLVDGLLGEVVASAVAPVNVVANINPDEDGNGLVPNLLGRVSATIQASPTVTLHIFDPDNNDEGELMRRDLVEDLLGEVVASVVAPVNIMADINPDEDGNGLVPNLLGRVSATIQASPTVTAHLFDADKHDGGLLRRDLVDGLLGEVVASVVAPVNVVANINPDEDGNGLVPNLLGRVSATIQASPTVTLHIFDPDNNDEGQLMRRDLVDGLLGEVVASVVAPVNVVANINPDEDASLRL